MARSRTKKNAWMPPGVKFNGHNYKIRSKLTNGKQVALCSGNATRAQVWAAYEALSTDSVLTLDKICIQYLNSSQFKKKAPGTQHLYHARHKSLSEITFNSGQKLLDISPDHVTPGMLQQVLDFREKEGSPVKGNREIKGFLSAVYTWAIARDLVSLPANPCRAVQGNKEKAREHYVEDSEFALVIRHAEPWLANTLQLCYLLYARISEVLALTSENILTEGVLVIRAKGSKDNIVEWSPWLTDIINSCKTSDSFSNSVLTRANGKPVTYAMIKKPLKALMQKCMDLDSNFRPFTPHDLKRKSMTDQEIEQNSAGHISRQMQLRYQVRPELVKPPKKVPEA